jgi:hypothetical protein
MSHRPLTNTSSLKIAAAYCTVYLAVYSVQCTLYSVQCTVYTVQCTVYSWLAHVQLLNDDIYVYPPLYF